MEIGSKEARVTVQVIAREGDDRKVIFFRPEMVSTTVTSVTRQDRVERSVAKGESVGKRTLQCAKWKKYINILPTNESIVSVRHGPLLVKLIPSHCHILNRTRTQDRFNLSFIVVRRRKYDWTT